MASVDVVNVRKSYGATEVIHNVSANIADGEFVILVGPSGCGKSTLLRMIAGLESITAGDIRIGERVVNHLAPKDRDIAMVFQNYALYPHKTVAENMGFALNLRHASKVEIETRVLRQEIVNVTRSEIRLRNGITHFVVIAGKQGFDYLVRDPGAGAAKGFYPLRELGSDIEALRFYQPLVMPNSRLSAQR